MARPKPIHEQLHKRKGHILIDNVMVPKDKVMACYLSDSILTLLENDDFGKLMIDKYLLWDVSYTYHRLRGLIRQMNPKTDGNRVWRLINNFLVLLYHKGFKVNIGDITPNILIEEFVQDNFIVYDKSFIYRGGYRYGRGYSNQRIIFDDDWYIHQLHAHIQQTMSRAWRATVAAS